MEKWGNSAGLSVFTTRSDNNLFKPLQPLSRRRFIMFENPPTSDLYTLDLGNRCITYASLFAIDCDIGQRMDEITISSGSQTYRRQSSFAHLCVFECSRPLSVELIQLSPPHKETDFVRYQSKDKEYLIKRDIIIILRVVILQSVRSWKRWVILGATDINARIEELILRVSYATFFQINSHHSYLFQVSSTAVVRLIDSHRRVPVYQSLPHQTAGTTVIAAACGMVKRSIIDFWLFVEQQPTLTRPSEH
ncbi:hypothetical protein QTP88_003515 [Uroleucon formosanum]